MAGFPCRQGKKKACEILITAKKMAFSGLHRARKDIVHKAGGAGPGLCNMGFNLLHKLIGKCQNDDSESGWGIG